MPGDEQKARRARLFVALDLPDEVRSGLASWQADSLSGERGLRPVRPEALHLTLAFLGYVPERELDRVAEVVAATKASAPRIQLHPSPVPVPRTRPRLYAIEAESTETVAIQAGLSERLEALGLYEPETRPFWPHVTVARVRARAGGRRRPAPVGHPLGELPQELEQLFDAVRLSLYRSNLRPEGAEYVSLAKVELPPQAV